MNKVLLILLTFVLIQQLSFGQLLQNFTPNVLTEYSRNLLNGITNNGPIFNGYTSAFAAAVNSVAWVPHALAKALGHATLPMPYSEPSAKSFDIVGFVSDYIRGFGNEDAKLHISPLIQKYGFICENHTVETQDGFLLTMFRIPGKGASVFLMHGLLGSADDYILAGRDSALAYLLADAGYDVWLGNNRGNKHSRNHTTLDPSEEKFWDFSYHEIGMYDLPAMIDYVLNVTSKDSLFLVAFSQGTTAFFVMASELPEYNDKITLMVAMSPITFGRNINSPLIRILAPSYPIIHRFTKKLGFYEFMPDSSLVRTLKLWVCGTGPLADILCHNSMFIFFGFDYTQLNVTNLRVIYGHLPAGAAVKQFAHFAQGVGTEGFKMFDYGSDENVKRYGVDVPPHYALGNVKTPVALFYSESDWMADPRDVEKLIQSLSNVVEVYKIPHKNFNHADFVMAKDVKKLVYNKVLETLALYD